MTPARESRWSEVRLGPVSFEGLDAGSSRAQAMAMAASLRNAGIRIVAVNEETAGVTSQFTIVIGSADLDLARRTLAAAEASGDT